jgi:menaquinone-specific isochorismate synthase
MTDLAVARTLLARTVPLEPSAASDLFAWSGDGGLVWEREGTGLAGKGVALRVELPYGMGETEAAERVSAALAAVEADDTVGQAGCGPVAIGALPFDRDAPAGLIVPETVVGRSRDGSAWLTTIGPEGAAVHRAAVGALPPPAAEASPDAFQLVATRSHTDWCAAVEAAAAAVRAGQFEKVVLAREVAVEANRPIVVSEVLRRLRALYPSCMLFSVEGFVGASPELLVSRRGRAVRSHPLAGTVPRSGDPDTDERLARGLLASAKDRAEHRVVVDAVAGALAGICDRLEVPPAPSIVPLRNVSHLGTAISGTLAAGAPPASALELAIRLHPTPAVAGTPTAAALEYLNAVEGFDRGRYAGPVGWVDAHGDGEFAIGIRSADISGNRARLVAGVGIVADSVAESELAETQFKLQALLAAVVRP